MTQNIRIFVLVGCLVIFTFNRLQAQNTDVLEPWLDLIQEDPTLAEILTELVENPININRAQEHDWQKLPLITQEEIDSILTLRHQKGLFRSLNEIKKIIGKEKFQRLKPFLTSQTKRVIHFKITQRNYWLVENPSQISEQNFMGSPIYNLTRLQYKAPKNWQFGLIAQKDIGERDFTDYWNMSLLYQTKQWQLIAGSFYLQTGQGLLFASPFGKVKSSLVMLPFKNPKNVAQPYWGSSENFALNGICFSGHFFNNSIAIFGAHNLRDGRYNSRTLKIIGFDYSGYHRTPNELSKKDLISEKMIGASFKKRLFTNLKIELTGLKIHFTPGIEFNNQNVSFSELRRNYYHFNGNQILLGSFAYSLNFEKLHFTGEVAKGYHSGSALVQGLWFGNKKFKSGLLFWHLSKNFQSPYGRVLGDVNPFPRATEGLYLALSWVKFNWRIHFYKFFSKDLWRNYASNFPNFKDELFFELHYKLGQGLFLFRWRQKSVTTNQVELLTTNNLRLQFTFWINDKVQFKTRVESSSLRRHKEKGVLTFQELKIPFNKHLSIATRISFFKTDSWKTRLYEYESDVPGSFANFANYGQGFKWYVYFKWAVLKYLKLWLKFRYLKINDRHPTDIDFGRSEQNLDRLIRLQAEIFF